MAKMSIVWDRTAAFVGERLGTLLPVALAAFVLPGVAGSCVQVLAASSPSGARLGLGALSLLLSLPSVWGSLVVIGLATGVDRLGDAARLAMRRLPATILVSIILGLVAALTMLPIAVILAASGYDVAAIAAGQAGKVVVNPQASGMVALYFIVLVPVLLFAFTRLLLVTPVVLRESVLFGAVRRSWVLTRKHGWRIFGMLLLFGLIGGIAQLAAQAVFGTVFTLLAGGGQGLTTAFVLTTIATTCVQAIVMVLLAAFQGRLYAALTTADSVWRA
ncbi:hypothetical protein [Sphingomonas sp.]|uniref:hypothetical protein n=1 Tax=Sphingomonas sp. TaxID=28214 RepID=UPI002FD92922